MPEYAPLPNEAKYLCDAVAAPPRLVAHLTLVHDVAIRLTAQIRTEFPSVTFDQGDVLFGAATHDIGKTVVPVELSAPGKTHEIQGRELLTKLDVSARKARFAYSHGNYDQPLPLEDLLVALADKCWKGQRTSELEDRVVLEIAQRTNRPTWEVFGVLDSILSTLSESADERLAWQAEFSTH